MRGVTLICFGCIAVALVTSIALAAEPTSQPVWQKLSEGELMLRPFKNAPFPHASREKGFGKFPREPHYTDSTVGIFIPKHFSPGEEVDLVVYFHGHTNNVARVFERYELARQMTESKVNAILLIPQGPKDAADSGGGHLELDEGAFGQLVGEVMRFLKQEKKVPTAKVGHIALIAHSGGYKVASAILYNGGMGRQITDVLLFDATYGAPPPFANWCRQDHTRRLVSLYGEDLVDENSTLMEMMETFKVPMQKVDEVTVTDAQLGARGGTFMPTAVKHDEIPIRYFGRLLKTSGLAKRAGAAAR